jgi:hypothetical protein
MKTLIKTTQITTLLALFIAILMVPNTADAAISRSEAERAVRNAYNECLGRNPDSGGLNHHVNIIMNGKAAHEVRKDICKSEEAQRFKEQRNSSSNTSADNKRAEAERLVRNAYSSCLGRSPETSGLNHHVNLILNGKSSSQVRKDICNSQEAKDYKSGNSNNQNNNYSNTSNSSSIPACSLPGDYIVNLGGDVFYATQGETHKRTIDTNIPSGKYRVKVQTWDDHSGHGGQGQTKEIVHINLYNNNGDLMYEGLRSSDVPENSDWQNTNLGTLDINEAVKSIFVKHAYYGNSNSPESVVPLCMSFDEVEPYNPPSNDLDVECRVSDTRIEEGDEVTFEAIVSGGNSPFDYDWDGDVNSSQRKFDVEFEYEGNYYVSVEVRDEDGRRASDSCPVIIVEEEDEDNDDLEVQCEVSDSRIEEGDRVTIEVDIDGGDGPYDIQWSGDDDEIDDFDDNDRSQRVRIDDEGTYRLRVTVEDDDGNRDSDTCTIRVGEDDGDINVLSNTDGQLAGLSSVYLNQVPYTGPEDNLKIFGFISLILIWSALVAFYLLKDRQKKQVSNRIQAFKEANRAKLEA